MNYGASAIDEAAPVGIKVLPAPCTAESAAPDQADEKTKRAQCRTESLRLAIAAQEGCIESFESLVGQFEKPLYRFLLAKTRIAQHKFQPKKTNTRKQPFALLKSGC